MLVVGCLLFFVQTTSSIDWSSLNLVRSHIPYVFSHQPRLKQQCLEDDACPYKELLSQTACWGFEHGCSGGFSSSVQTLDCANERSKSKYWYQADFGYVRDRLNELESLELCKSTGSNASLRCTREATMCEAHNLYVDLRSLRERTMERDKVVLQTGEIGGNCKLDQDALKAETASKRELSTWGEQLAPYSELAFDPFAEPDKYCDKVINEPVFFLQLDFGGNMYHHFCDFFNLYLTQLVNNSCFDTDINVVRWSSSPRYGELFSSSWKAFSKNNLISLHHLGEGRICLSNVIFAFLPRMAFGLYYSTPLEWGCRGSALFRAFSQHFLHRMGIVDEHLVPTSPPTGLGPPSRIRVTVLDRGFTAKYTIYRRVLNQDELVDAIKKDSDLDVQVAKYSREMPFEEQLSITHNTDIFIGMHGAGLAHFMFLPDWAVAFELFNCGDVHCYLDLAHLAGHRYLTWEDTSKVFEHDKDKNDNAKFWNYSFDVDEFVRQVEKAKSWVVEHPRFAHLERNHSEL